MVLGARRGLMGPQLMAVQTIITAEPITELIILQQLSTLMQRVVLLVVVGMPQGPPLQEPLSERQPLMLLMPIPMQKVTQQEPKIRPIRWQQFIRPYHQEQRCRPLGMQLIISITGFGLVLPMGLMGFIIVWFLRLNYLNAIAF